MSLAINDAYKKVISFTKQAANADDNAVIYTSGDLTWANYHIFEGVANNADVFVSLDGTNFTANPIYLYDMYAAAPDANMTPTIAANKVYKLEGRFKKIKIQNAGAAQATIRVAHAIK